MSAHGTIRDPLWNTIAVDATAMRIVDSAAFQRLRHIKQLGHAHLVYPGATHTRFDHALGVFHLAGRALDLLAASGALTDIDPTDRQLVRLAALLHDIGHYPFSHALEELSEGRIPGHHEALAGRFLADPDVAAALRDVAADAAERVEQLIRGTSSNPLQGLVSGSLDLDKIEYLKRDARFCGVPYGEVDVDRLLQTLTLVQDPAGGRFEIGVQEKGVAALESLLFAKYQMFRNVYWHHAVRAATVMYKRIVDDALISDLLGGEDLVGRTDEGLMHLLADRVAERHSDPAAATVVERIRALQARRLPKRLAEISAAELGPAEGDGWLETDSPLKRAAEDRIAEELGLDRGVVFLDYPEKAAMFGLDLLLERRTGEVIRLGPGGRAGLIGLPRIADELYRSARVLRLYALGGRPPVSAQQLARLAELRAVDVEARLAEDASFLRI